jgi:hypothetical protein
LRDRPVACPGVAGSVDRLLEKVKKKGDEGGADGWVPFVSG